MAVSTPILPQATLSEQCLLALAELELRVATCLERWPCEDRWTRERRWERRLAAFQRVIELKHGGRATQEQIDAILEDAR